MPNPRLPKTSPVPLNSTAQAEFCFQSCGETTKTNIAPTKSTPHMSTSAHLAEQPHNGFLHNPHHANSGANRTPFNETVGRLGSLFVRVFVHGRHCTKAALAYQGVFRSTADFLSCEDFLVVWKCSTSSGVSGGREDAFSSTLATISLVSTSLSSCLCRDCVSI